MHVTTHAAHPRSPLRAFFLRPRMSQGCQPVCARAARVALLLHPTPIPASKTHVEQTVRAPHAPLALHIRHPPRAHKPGASKVSPRVRRPNSARARAVLGRLTPFGYTGASGARPPNSARAHRILGGLTSSVLPLTPSRPDALTPFPLPRPPPP